MIVSKYSASGNDFVIFHTFLKKDRTKLAKELCDRQNGVGADGLIVILPHEKYDFEWQFYNADGSIAEMCGNGSRAAAHYAYVNGLAPKKMKFLSLAGVIEAEVDGDIVESQLTVHKIIKELGEWKLFDTGVPHLVKIDNIENFDVNECRQLRYEHNANVNVAEVKNGSLYVRTYERGVEDETLACGTGMCASFLYAREKGLVGNEVTVYPKSGEKLHIKLKNGRLYFKGKVKNTFIAKINVTNSNIL
jgi:diaminopimelate epimerase